MHKEAVEARVAERSKAADSRSAGATRTSSNLVACKLFCYHKIMAESEQHTKQTQQAALFKVYKAYNTGEIDASKLLYKVKTVLPPSLTLFRISALSPQFRWSATFCRIPLAVQRRRISPNSRACNISPLTLSTTA